MMRSLVTLSLCALLASCGGSGSPESEDVIVETFNTALAGAFIPYEAARRQPIADAIAQSDSDIFCLQEVWEQVDKELIADTAIDAYPYSAFFHDTLDTAIDDPTDQQGEVPPAPTGVPCPDVEVGEGANAVNIQDQMNAAVDCLRDNCSTLDDPSDDSGRTTSEACASDACVPEVAGLLFGNEQQQRCYACVVTQLPTSTFETMRTTCANDENQDLAFDGQNGLMILSRHPLRSAAEWVLPGTWNRRVILSATAELPNGSELDVYCNHLTPIFRTFTFPYTGQYGDGMTGADGWQAEQELQAEKLIDYVTVTSGSRPAVVLGDFNTGSAYPAQDIAPEAPETLAILESAFPPGYAASYTPLCTYCSTNPVTNPEDEPDFASVWIDQILLYNLESSSVVATARVFDEDVVPVPVATGGTGGAGGSGGAGEMLVPLSDHYGLRSVVSVP